MRKGEIGGLCVDICVRSLLTCGNLRTLPRYAWKTAYASSLREENGVRPAAACGDLRTLPPYVWESMNEPLVPTFGAPPCSPGLRTPAKGAWHQWLGHAYLADWGFPTLLCGPCRSIPFGPNASCSEMPPQKIEVFLPCSRTYGSRGMPYCFPQDAL